MVITMKGNNTAVSHFNFTSGRTLARKYEVIELLGAGWEGEAYLIIEISTGIGHAAKSFFPKRTQANPLLIEYASNPHILRHRLDII